MDAATPRLIAGSSEGRSGGGRGGLQQVKTNVNNNNKGRQRTNAVILGTLESKAGGALCETRGGLYNNNKRARNSKQDDQRSNFKEPYRYWRRGGGGILYDATLEFIQPRAPLFCILQSITRVNFNRPKIKSLSTNNGSVK